MNTTLEVAGWRILVSDEVARSAVRLGSVDRGTIRVLKVACQGRGSTEPTAVAEIDYDYIPGLEPGVLFETASQTLFVGAGTGVNCYRLVGNEWVTFWRKSIECCFHGWVKVGGVVLQLAELEVAGFSDTGDWLWTRAVVPPWDYKVDGRFITIKSDFGEQATVELTSGRMI